MNDAEILYLSLGLAMALRTSWRLIEVSRAKTSKDAKLKARFLYLTGDKAFPKSVSFALSGLVYTLWMMASILIWPVVLASMLAGDLKRKA